MRPSKRVHGALFSLSVSPSATGAAQVACVVSKKVSPKATVRNLVKRRCREAARACALPSHALVFTAKAAAAKATYAAVKADVQALVARA